MNSSLRLTHIILPGGIIFNLPHTGAQNTPDNNESERKPTAAANILPQHEPIRIILADDDSDDREMFAEAIEKTDANVQLSLATDGSELLNMLHENHQLLPHLILLDLNMPKKSGKECLDMIRNNEKFRSIPVVIYSTSSMLKDIDETFEKGANLYIRKPSSFNDLVTIARKVLTLDWNKHKPNMLRSNFVFTLHPNK